MKNNFLVLASIMLMLSSCTKVPITGRKQLNLMPESEMIGMSLTAYDEFLSENPPLPLSDPRAKMISDMGARISSSVIKYMTDNGLENRIEGFSWTFNTVDDPTVNAWCMPGGKVVFYTGIIDVANSNENQLAAVMGHEIAHAVARHGNERMSSSMASQLGVSALSIALSENPTLTNQLFMQAAGIGTQVGMLKFSRNHETEADKMGLIFMSMAGYDPHAAVDFWQRMSEASGGAPPEFLSTHPSHDRRISDLEEYMPEALIYYKP
jgi:predicted Zn-dependent protease